MTFTKLHYFEGLLLLSLTPILLFPLQSVPLTISGSILLIGVWVVEYLTSQSRLIPHSAISIIWLIIFMVVAVGTFVSADRIFTYPKIAGLFLAFAWWRYLTYITNKKNMPWLLAGILFIANAFTLFGVAGAKWPSKIPVFESLIVKISEITLQLPLGIQQSISTNQIAGTILLFLPITGTLVVIRKIHWLLRLICVFITVYLFFLLIITQSRSGWLGGLVVVFLFFGILVASFESKHVRRTMLLFLLLICISLLVVLTQVDSVTIAKLWQEPPTDTSLGDLSTLQFRREVWSWAVIAIGDFPFTGTGLGTFRAVVRRLYPLSVPVTYDIAHAHNFFLQVALDIGLIGLIAYMALLFNAGWMCIQLLQRQDALQNALGQGFLISIIGFHVFGLADALALGSKTHIIFWMFLGIVTGAFVNGYELDTDDSTVSRQDRSPVAPGNL